ncbi:PH domain-containing protein [Mucilaginibacter pineti]|nr:PH domain-containing protein [Mucilaginibacter pineti]
MPFVFAGLYVIVGRFFYDKQLRAKTIYGITSNRIIIKSGVIKKTVNVLNIKTLPNLTISEKADGSGNIKLAVNNNPFSGFTVYGWPGIKEVPELRLIPDVRSVFNLILKQQNNNIT